MSQISVGYQDGCLAPLFVSTYSIQQAEKMGADTIWFPDHFMGFAPKWLWTPDICAAANVIHSGDALFDPAPVMAHFAAKFPNLRIGTSVTEAIRRHPVSLAQTFVTLDYLSEGRVVLGIGNGLRENTEPYGLPSKQRVARFEEALEVLQLLFASGGTPVDYEGRFYRLDGAVFDLPLWQDRPPPLFIGAHAPRMLGLTGRFADGWLPGQPVSGEEYGRRLGVISSAAAAAGRAMDGFVAAQTMLLVIGEDRAHLIEQAMASPYIAYNSLGLPGAVWRQHGLDHPFGDDFAGQIELIPAKTTRESVEAAQARMTPELLAAQYYFGTPQQIAEQAAPLADAGCTHFILANMGGNFTGRGAKDFESMGELTRLLKAM
ncbi:MAG: LLM class flavin-dependent oxidoreductase [Candidatus Binatia bacterium]|nr:LLM class flavin-dependent oxidoreductase [Candidatus Binatia bacterium]